MFLKQFQNITNSRSMQEKKGVKRVEKKKTVPEGESQERQENQICPTCGQENSPKANFCKKCATKLRNWCYCWVRGKQKFDCGEKECRGFDNLIDEATNRKE